LWQNFGEGREFDDQRRIIRRAVELGITHFDLANNYGPPPGAAERTFGRILATDLQGHRDELVVSTKAGYEMWPGPYGDGGSRKYLLASLDQSLTRLGVDYVDIFYSHRFDDTTPLDETMGALDTAVRQGKALYAGISSYSSRQTADAARLLRGLGTPLLIHQPSYSLVDRWIEADHLLETLDTEGVGCIVFSPLAQGLLSDRYLETVPEDSRASARDTLFPEMISSGYRRRAARADPGPDGAGLDGARPARDVRAGRGQQRHPARGQRRGPRRTVVRRRRARRARSAHDPGLTDPPGQ
jgi:L-glyceraldehyde 3-phosphate reductase